MAGDTNQVPDVFVKNLQTGATSLLSTGSSGTGGQPSISYDGRYVSLWHNLGKGVSIYDRTTGVDKPIANVSELTSPRALSADGKFVVFDSYSSTIVPGDTNGTWDTFVANRDTGAIERVSVSSTGQQGNDVSGRGYNRSVAISGDGRYVIFLSAATNLVPNDTNGEWDAFVHDRLTHRTARVNGQTGGQINASASEGLAISGDGRYVGIHTEGDVIPNQSRIGPQAYVQANPLPTVTSVLPSTIARGTTKTVTITGSGFVANAADRLQQYQR